MDEAKRRLSGALGHEWRDEALLDAALLHRSAAVERGMGDWAESQRLEFLGDAVLDLLAADWLMRRLPGVREGRLTALVGVEDLVVVQTDGVTLVCSKSHSQDIKGLLAKLRSQEGREHLF